MYCIYCGKRIHDRSKYCIYCGKTLPKDGKEDSSSVGNAEGKSESFSEYPEALFLSRL